MNQKQKLLELIDQYAEARHIQGHSTYNIKTAAAPQQESTASNESAYQRGYLDGMAKGRRDVDAAPQQEVQEPTTVDKKTMELAESVGLIGPASRVGDLHAAIQRFHDLICVNATIKAAVMAAEAIGKQQAAPQQEAQEPYAYAVYFPDQPKVELVHDLDELIDDLTNQTHVVTKLYTAPQPAPAPLSDDAKDAARWRMVALIGNEVMLHPEKRTQAAAVKAYMDATHGGLDLTGAVDAALAARGGEGMTEPIYVCPECGSDHYCHSMKPQDADSPATCIDCQWIGERRDLKKKGDTP